VALEILIEGRMWDAREAYDKGLLTRVAPDARLAAEVAAAARRIAEAAPLVNRSHKKMIRRIAPMPVPLTEAEIEESFGYFNTEDYRIGYDAFLHKKKPKFTGK
jgi:enoyl-CoA hydratase/carnithine racemase